MSVVIDGTGGIISPAAVVGNEPLVPVTQFKNRIINGDMRIDQRFNGVTQNSFASGYVLDRWLTANNASNGTINVGQSVITGTLKKSFKQTVGTACTSLTGASYVYGLLQRTEVQNCYDLNSQNVTVSFTIETNWSGNFPVAIRNSGLTRSYVTNVAIVSGVNNCSVTIPLESNTVVTSNSSRGLDLVLGFCNQGTFQTATPNTWVTGNFISSTSSTAWCATAGNFINITDVQLEKGSVATSFDYRPYGTELALCQRYFVKTYNQSQAPGTAAAGATPICATSTGNAYGTIGVWCFPVTMRAVPTVTGYAPSNGATGSFNGDSAIYSQLGIHSPSEAGVAFYVNNNAIGVNTFFAVHATASAEL